MIMSDHLEEVIPILLLGGATVGKSTFLSYVMIEAESDLAELIRPRSRVSLGPRAASTASLPTLRDEDQPFVFDIRGRNASQTFRLEFFDTASPTNFTLLRPSMIILCYDISIRDTLKEVQTRWKNLVETHFNYDEALPVMLLGLKRDLRTVDNVHPQDALRVAAEMRCDRYAECSAMTGELVAEVFEDIVKMAVATTKGWGGGRTSGPSCSVM